MITWNLLWNLTKTLTFYLFVFLIFIYINSLWCFYIKYISSRIILLSRTSEMVSLCPRTSKISPTIIGSDKFLLTIISLYKFSIRNKLFLSEKKIGGNMFWRFKLWRFWNTICDRCAFFGFKSGTKLFWFDSHRLEGTVQAESFKKIYSVNIIYMKYRSFFIKVFLYVDINSYKNHEAD